MSDAHPELMEAFKKEKKKRPSVRMLIVHNVVNLGMKIPLVAKMFDKSYNTVKNCCERFKERGISGLYDAPRSGRPKKIENETLDKYIGDTSKGVDLETLAGELVDKFDVKYTPSGMRAKAHSMGWSCKKTQPALHRRAPMPYTIGWCHETGEWLDELEKDGFDAWMLDQHLVHNDHNPKRRMWSAIGTPIWRPKYPNRSKFYMFGGFSTSGSQLFRNIGKYNAKGVLSVLKQIHQKHGQIGIIWDRASQHTSNIVLDYVADHSSDIRLQWFPTAWPELDPVEGYWSKLQRHMIMNRVFETVEERERAIMNVVRTMRPNMDIRKILTKSTLIQKIPGDTKYFDLEACIVTEEPLTPGYIARCKNFLA